MDKVLEGLPVGCILDDIIITGKDDDEHDENLDKTLKRLQDYGIRLNAKKCALKQDSVVYFAFIVDAEGIHPSPEKVQAIIEVPEPTNVTELQSFLGLVNYYRKFLPNMSTMCAPLNNLLHKDVPWDWNAECRDAFQHIKDRLTSTEVLTHYDPAKQLVMAVDASPVGLGAVISHMDGEEEKPIAFASRSLTAAEKNYSQIEREGLAIMFGLEKFHQYQYGRTFILITDNKPLTQILGPKKGIPTQAASRLQRWAIKLSAYQYQICYRSSKDNQNVDTLSRLPLKVETTSTTGDVFATDEVQNLHRMQISNLPVSVQQIRTATQNDVILSRVVQFTINGWPQTDIAPELMPFHRVKDELTVEEGCLLRGI
jgi:hypothetical protein